MSELYTFENQGALLQRTNYFDSPAAQAGEFYLTWNAWAARFLVPDIQKPLLIEMKDAKKIEIELLEGGILIVFDDATDNPFVVSLPLEQCDRVLSQKDRGAEFGFYVYIRLGEKFYFKGVIV